MRKVNALVFPIVGGLMQPAGWPDRYYSHTIWSGFLEMKYEDGEVTTIQRSILRGLVERKVPAYVLRFSNWYEGLVTVSTENVFGDKLVTLVEEDVESREFCLRLLEFLKNENTTS
jgi:hypothetical protein